MYEVLDVNGRPLLAWEVLFRYSHIKIFNIKSIDAMSLKITGMIIKYFNFEFVCVLFLIFFLTLFIVQLSLTFW